MEEIWEIEMRLNLQDLRKTFSPEKYQQLLDRLVEFTQSLNDGDEDQTANPE